MTNCWQQDAKDILIFVSGPVAILTDTKIVNCSNTDWSIFRCCFHATRRIRPGPQAKFTRYLHILSCEHLSGSRRSKCYRDHSTHIYSFHSHHPAPILSSDIHHLGEL